MSIVAFIFNMVLAYLICMVCRVEYILLNWDTLGDTLFDNSWLGMLKGALLFDTSAILYTHVFYAMMMLLPIHYQHRGRRLLLPSESHSWQQVAKWYFIIVNSLAIILNFADSVYFRFTGRRTTMSVLHEFENEGNLGNILLAEVSAHWYLFLLGILMIYLMCKLYVMPTIKVQHGAKNLAKQYAIHLLCFVIYVPLTIAGMRGGFTHAVRPITISNANQYVSHPQEAAAILNTPFSLIRTIGKQTFKVPNYNDSEVDTSYTAIHQPDVDAVPNKKNVVVLIVESFGREYVESGYAPFVHSLESRSLTFAHSFANGRKSIDGMPSILSSIPMFVEPFFLTDASMNNLSGLAGELNHLCYQTAFFHGAENGSMGFEAFAKATGFQHYYGRTEYSDDSRFNGDDDFDGTWAIWDEPFLQYYALKMSEMRQPFMTAVFTASSHHPFNVPDQYKNVYKDDGKNPMHKCIRYTDMAIRCFFETASRQPWYRNTIFVITCDHTNGADTPQYSTDLGVYAAPIIIYDPSADTVKPERRDAIAQQIDIMPTVLSLLGYDKPFIAFGQDLMRTDNADTWAVNYNNGIYQFIHGNRFIQFDGNHVTACYDFVNDPLLKRNLVNKLDKDDADVKRLKAIIREYMLRMTSNQLTAYPAS